MSQHLTRLLRNLYAGQEATVRTVHGTTVSKLGKKYIKAYCYLTYLIYMQSTSCKNDGLNESQTGNKIAWRNIKNLRYADDTTFLAEIEDELKSLLNVKEESEKAGLKLNIQKTKIMASSPIT